MEPYSGTYDMHANLSFAVLSGLGQAFSNAAEDTKQHCWIWERAMQLPLSQWRSGEAS
jgi:hypothetical protein